MLPIQSTAGPQALTSTPQLGGKISGADSGQVGSFKNMLMSSIENVNGMQQQADLAVEALFTGGDVNPAEVLTAVQKADMAFKMTMQVRNKLMDVYREIQEVRI